MDERECVRLKGRLEELYGFTVTDDDLYVVDRLGALLDHEVITFSQSRFAGAIGAALRARAMI